MRSMWSTKLAKVFKVIILIVKLVTTISWALWCQMLAKPMACMTGDTVMRGAVISGL